MKELGPDLQALLFDIDGTLADTDDRFVNQLSALLGPLRILSPTFEPYGASRRLVMRAESPVNALLAWLDRRGLDESLGPLMDLLHRLKGESTGPEEILIEGVAEALDTLQGRYPLAIVTSRETRAAQSFLHLPPLQGMFQVVATARTCDRAKPHPGPVLWAASQLGVPTERCAMVGDTVVDILAGKAAGAWAVGVLCGFGEREELERAGADWILESPADLPTLLLT